MISIGIFDRSFFRAGLAAAALFAFGCSHSEDHGEEGGVKEDACEHMADGPALAVTAAGSGDGPLPDVSASHTRFDIALAPAGVDRGGFLAFKADGKNDFFFALNRAAALDIRDSAGTAMVREGAVDTASGCAVVKGIHAYELPAGTFILRLAAPDSSVSLVTVEGSSHAH